MGTQIGNSERANPEPHRDAGALGSLSRTQHPLVAGFVARIVDEVTASKVPLESVLAERTLETLHAVASVLDSVHEQRSPLQLDTVMTWLRRFGLVVQGDMEQRTGVFAVFQRCPSLVKCTTPGDIRLVVLPEGHAVPGTHLVTADGTALSGQVSTSLFGAIEWRSGRGAIRHSTGNLPLCFPGESLVHAVPQSKLWVGLVLRYLQEDPD